MKLTIIGASGHGKVVADIAKLRGYDGIEFLDDDENLTQCGSYPVVGKTDRALEVKNDIFIGIGNALIRKRFQAKGRRLKRSLGVCVFNTHLPLCVPAQSLSHV